MIANSLEVRAVPIAAITVLNPRSRNKKIFQELVTSIAHLGLKKPITVAARHDGSGYDLVCGQGRLEAFLALGESEIPAVVIDASHEDCFVMSLVENLARRQHSPLELMRRIGDLRKRGYTIAQIASKTDFSDEYIYAICYLLEHGEQRLLAAVERGVIPPTVAMEIARAKDGDVQQALAEAYERKSIPGRQVLAIRRIIEQRASSRQAHDEAAMARKHRRTRAGSPPTPSSERTERKPSASGFSSRRPRLLRAGCCLSSTHSAACLRTNIS